MKTVFQKPSIEIGKRKEKKPKTDKMEKKKNLFSESEFHYNELVVTKTVLC